MAETFDDDETAVVAALADAHMPSLLCAIMQFTGSAAHLADFQRPVFDIAAVGDESGGIPVEQQAKARRTLADLLLKWRAEGYPALPEAPAADVLQAINFIAGADVPDSYHAFLTDELVLDGPRPATGVTIDADPDAKGAFPILVVGAGMSGLLAGIALKQAGLPFTIVEARSEVGGTWAANRYPGVRVDTPNHLYSYSFEPAHEWPLRYSTGDVLQDYFERIADKYDLRPHIRFKTSVVSAAWDGAAWQVEIDSSAGRETLASRVVISAVGQLNRPKFPDIPGLDCFTGASFHSAEWHGDIDLAGKRVAVIGTGASAFQIVPEIAGKVASLSIFQRTPPWMLPQPFYHDAVSPGKNWALKHVPGYASWYRFSLFWSLTEFLLPFVEATPDWTAPGSISPLNADLRALLEGSVAAQVEGRPDLLAKMIPDYAPGGKRMLVDNGVWATALRRDNVELITDKVTGIEPTGVRLADGRLVEADVLIYATGFHASEFLLPMRVKGDGGRDLHATWAGEPRAYLGMTVPGFPNFFTIYGPNTNIVVNGSIVFFSECSVNYIMGCLKLLIEGQNTGLSPKRDVHDAYNARVDEANARMSWGAAGVSSWYKSSSGRVSQNWPFALVDYWTATRAPDPAEFELS